MVALDIMKLKSPMKVSAKDNTRYSKKEKNTFESHLEKSNMKRPAKKNKNINQKDESIKSKEKNEERPNKNQLKNNKNDKVTEDKKIDNVDKSDKTEEDDKICKSDNKLYEEQQQDIEVELTPNQEKIIDLLNVLNNELKDMGKEAEKQNHIKFDSIKALKEDIKIVSDILLNNHSKEILKDGEGIDKLQDIVANIDEILKKEDMDNKSSLRNIKRDLNVLLTQGNIKSNKDIRQGQKHIENIKNEEIDIGFIKDIDDNRHVKEQRDIKDNAVKVNMESKVNRESIDLVKPTEGNTRHSLDVTNNGNNFNIEMVSNNKSSNMEAIDSKGFNAIIDKENILEQILDKAKVVIKDKSSEMEIKLKPEFLGKLSIKLAVEKGVLTAKATVDNHEIKQLIETNMNQLKDSLNEQGLDIGAFDVSVTDDGSYEQRQFLNWMSNKSKNNKKKILNSAEYENNTLYVNETHNNNTIKGMYLNSNIDFMA